MVPFGEWEMPLHYSSILEEHRAVRNGVGLFDVSHMGQLVIEGPGVVRALEKLLPCDLEALLVNQQNYTLLTNEVGGILDDLIITRWAQDRFFLVVNAACKSTDIAHLKARLDPSISLHHLTERALLALQGPAANEVMASLAPQALMLRFMSGTAATIERADVYVTRSGYTGEDGFEISLAAQDADRIARRILDFEPVQAIGLGARDSLRLEAGLCLYGHDMDQQTSPVEAGLSWAIAKSRRLGGAKQGGFPGADVILAQIAEGVARKRVGLKVEGRVPVREGASLLDAQDQSVGAVTSGGFAPSLGASIAMGYVTVDNAAIGTPLQALVRGKKVALQVVKLPFVPPNYYRG